MQSPSSVNGLLRSASSIRDHKNVGAAIPVHVHKPMMLHSSSRSCRNRIRRCVNLFSISRISFQFASRSCVGRRATTEVGTVSLDFAVNFGSSAGDIRWLSADRADNGAANREVHRLRETPSALSEDALWLCGIVNRQGARRATAYCLASCSGRQWTKAASQKAGDRRAEISS